MKINWLRLSIRKMEDEVIERATFEREFRRIDAAQEREIKRLVEERNQLHRDLTKMSIRYSNLLASLPALELMKRNEWR